MNDYQWLKMKFKERAVTLPANDASFCRYYEEIPPTESELRAEYFNRKMGLPSKNPKTKDLSDAEIEKVFIVKEKIRNDMFTPH